MGLVDARVYVPLLFELVSSVQRSRRQRWFLWTLDQLVARGAGVAECDVWPHEAEFRSLVRWALNPQSTQLKTSKLVLQTPVVPAPTPTERLGQVIGRSIARIDVGRPFPRWCSAAIGYVLFASGVAAGVSVWFWHSCTTRKMAVSDSRGSRPKLSGNIKVDFNLAAPNEPFHVPAQGGQ